MKTRCTLSHDTLGEKLIDGPDGIDGLVLSLIRHEDYHSLFENFEGEFWFFGSNGVIDGGLDFILEAERLDGPDVTINITFMIAPNDYVFITVFEGTLAVDGIRKGQDNRALIPVVRNDFSAKFKNRTDTPVDIMSEQDLDGNNCDTFSPIEVYLPSQKIQKTTTYNVGDNGEQLVEYEITDPTEEDIDADGPTMIRTYYHQVNVSIDQDEIPDSFDTVLDWVLDPLDIAPCIEMDTESGEVVVTVQPLQWFLGFTGTMSAESVEADPSVLDSLTVVARFYVQKNSEAPILLGIGTGDTVVGPFPTPGVPVPDTIVFAIFHLNYLGGTASLNVEAADTLRAFVRYDLTYNVDVGVDTGVIKWTNDRKLQIAIDSTEGFDSEISFVIQSLAPNSATEAFLLHDVAGQITDRIIGQPQSFYSELLGSDQTRYRQYDADGCQWTYILSKGLQLRKYTLTEKPFSLSFKQWWNGIQPILCLGIGYEVVNGVEVMRTEAIDDFYDPTPSVYIDNVKFTRRYDESVMIKTFRNGYKKWQSESISGIDDWAKHVRASRLQKSGTDLTMESDFIAAPLAIETTRRTSRKKSADYKFDDDTFIIAVEPLQTSPDGLFNPQTNEHFEYINGLLNADTRYNSIITPARNFIRWSKWLFGGLQNYVGSIFKFTGGEGNYDMSSEYAVSNGCDEYSEPLSEKQDFVVTEEYLHRGEVYDVEFELEIEDYLTIKNNRTKALAMSQTTTDHKIFFIKNLSYKAFESTVTGEVWALEFFDPEVVEEGGLDQVCYPHADACVDALLTELGIELITEDSECLVLE